MTRESHDPMTTLARTTSPKVEEGLVLTSPGTSYCHDDFERWLGKSFLGEHPLIRKVRALIAKAAAQDWPVLITGETGTGKDLIAQAIHAGSRRARHAAQVVAVGGLGETSWSVLFGHVKGAFTGAHGDHLGVFRTAHGSSVLLEDVSDLSIRVQPLLLRAIQHGLFRPLGARDEVRADVRIIASTNMPLDEEVRAGRFRADLFERLSVLKIEVPPLRDHLQDLKLYVPHFLARCREAGGPEKVMTDSALEALSRYQWPRNIRELEHFLFRASVEVDGTEIGAEDVSSLLQSGGRATRSRRGQRSMIDRLTLIRTLSETAGNKREAARRLHIAPGTMYSLLERYGVAPDEEKAEPGLTARHRSSSTEGS